MMIRPIALALACALAACSNGNAERSANALDDNIVAESGPADPARASRPETPSTVRIGNISLSYDPSKLAPVQTRVTVPPDWQEEVEGVKLIARDRAALIDTAECMYGESGRAQPCNAMQEAGLAIALIDRPFDAMKAALTEPPTTPVTIAGHEGVAWKIGAEGEGADHRLIPHGDKTLLIVNQYRNSGNPDAAAMEQALASLRRQGETRQ